MDLLSRRYANPHFFMDGMIRTGRFNEFVVKLFRTEQEEKDIQTKWEYFLHKVWEGSFESFKQGLDNEREHKNLSERTIETTVQHSMDILNNFNPEKEG